MIEIRQLKLKIDYTDNDLQTAIKKRLKGIPFSQVQITRKSIDSRKKKDLKYVITAICKVDNQAKTLNKLKKDKDINAYKPVVYDPMKAFAAENRLGESGKNVGDTLKQQPVELGQSEVKLEQSEVKLEQSPVKLQHPPVIVGFGPAGIFCALLLARNGYNPIVIERGKDVDSRTADIEEFWETGALKPDSNVQFGEGGAGAFSDGKLNTQVKDKYGRQTYMLDAFLKHGAPEEIKTDAKPHIGTDKLKGVIKGIREEIISLGGQVRFGHKLLKISSEKALDAENAAFPESEDASFSKKYEPKSTYNISVSDGDTEYSMETEVLVLALGHSARDTFEMIDGRGIKLEPKAFAVGVRVEHTRDFINESQYGSSPEASTLPTASYKLVYNANDGRGVFSFCMCPGGYVINSSSEPGMLVVNGMSNHDRMGPNSNSAIVVSVAPEDFGNGVFDGVKFQQNLERKAYELAKGKIPVERFGDFENEVREKYPDVFAGDKGESEGRDLAEYVSVEYEPATKGGFEFVGGKGAEGAESVGKTEGLAGIFPKYVSADIVEGMHYFDRKIKGFANPGTLLLGVESRTSSPIRIVRGRNFESVNSPGIYPCGEGAGYAGGISSAAMDGLKVAEAIMNKYPVG